MDSYYAGFLLFIVALFLYFIPVWIGWGKRNIDSVIVVNFLLGWTVLGWIVALVMALNPDDPQVIIQNSKEGKFDRLAKLKSLLDSGALTEAEYNQEKNKLLNKL